MPIVVANPSRFGQLRESKPDGFDTPSNGGGFVRGIEVGEFGGQYTDLEDANQVLEALAEGFRLVLAGA